MAADPQVPTSAVTPVERVNLDDLRRLREEALAAGPGSGRWIKCAQSLMDSFPAYYATAQAMNERHATDRVELAQLKALINSPEMDSFLRGVHLEAVHQVERWGTAHDRAKRPADWFWLVGYLSGKALRAAIGGNTAKALHHCISTAAALYNWHSAIKGTDTRMCPGRSDVAEIVERNFPGEA